MRLSLKGLVPGLIGLAAVALASACSTTNPNNTYVAPPSSVASAGPMTLSAQTSTQSLSSSGGVSGSVTYPGGSGTVTASVGTAVPSGVVAVQPAAIFRLARNVTSPNVYYVTIASTAGATLAGIPQIALTLTAPLVGPTPFDIQEAVWNGTAWANVTTASITVNATGTSIVAAPGTTSVTIPANGALYIAFYQGTYPAPTPTPIATPTNVLADSNFANPSVTPYAYAPNGTPAPAGSGGWTQCWVTAVSSAAPSATPPQKFSIQDTYTPNPNTTPAAVILPAATSIPIGTSTATPLPNQSTVPTYGGDAYAAVFGGRNTGYNIANFAYNGLCQQVKIPANPSLSMQLFENGNQGSSYFDFYVLLLDTSGNYLATVYADPNPEGTPPSSPGDTQYRLVQQAAPALQPYVGQTAELFVGIWLNPNASSSSKYSFYYFVDNFMLLGVPQ